MNYYSLCILDQRAATIGGAAVAAVCGMPMQWALTHTEPGRRAWLIKPF